MSLPKTEITLFSQSNTEHLKPVVTIDNSVLQYNQTTKLLGVHLYEKINFRTHTEVISHKASICLGVLREIASIAQLVERPLSEREVVGSNPVATPYQRCKKWY